MFSRYQKPIGLLYLIFLSIWYLVSTLTHNWLSSGDESIGLWKECNHAGCKTMQNSPSYDVPFLDWFSAVRSFMVLCCISVFIAMLLLLCSMKYEKHFHVKPVRVAVIFCAVFLIFAITVFAVEKRHVYDSSWDLDWSFYLTCVSLIFTVIGVVLFYKIQDNNIKLFPNGSTHIPMDSFPDRSEDLQYRQTSQVKPQLPVGHTSPKFSSHQATATALHNDFEKHALHPPTSHPHRTSMSSKSFSSDESESHTSDEESEKAFV